MAERGPEAAAGIAFYTLFSLFPLLVLLITGSSFLLEREEARQHVLNTLLELVPTASQDLIRRNILQILAARNTMGLVGIVGLLWSASGVFNGLFRNINRAWPNIGIGNVVKVRLSAVLIVLGLFVMLLLLFLVQAAMGFVASRDFPFGISDAVLLLISILSRVILYLFTFLALLQLYRWVPNTDVLWKEAAWGALFTLILSQLLTAGFSWYLSSGLDSYNLVYGSLGTLLSFMIWTYATSFIILWGGHVCAADANHQRPRAQVCDERT